MTKPVVYYRGDKDASVRLNKPAMVYTINHPSPLVSNTKLVLTSKVIAIQENGFETENSIYRVVSKGD